ncbi:adenylate/guanylate cyclase domain-containing protein [Ensifer sp. ENS09]|uniref:CHASE2 domain-containing protein n=1 Tax=Ensifer sp. ENS09 TaxID=2769263 RepID=UPI0019AF609E|nr:adenylate/guanylate cyclase domain-containing protein [Ensifer sp. ENS09]MBD9650269.1 adenylate/guanylate cyclase domain-containing protein [Ensifer sp. ENS09]
MSSRLKILLAPACLLTLILIWRAFDPGELLVRSRVMVFDVYTRLQPRNFESVPVRIIDIDDESLRRLGQWPWPRRLLADLTMRLNEMGAAAIGFDSVFAEEDRTAPKFLAQAYPEIEGLARLPDPDAGFADAIARAGNVVTGYGLSVHANGAAPAQKAGFAFSGADPAGFLPSFQGAVVNLSKLDDAAAGTGAFDFYPSYGLIVRAVPMVYALRGKLYPSLAAELLRVAQGARSYTLKAEAGALTDMRIGDFTVPLTARGELRMHFSRPEGARYVPAWKVLSTDAPPDLIGGHIVLIGTSAVGLNDIRASSLDPMMPGVEAHAQAIEQILLQSFLQRPDWAEGAEWLATLALGLLLMASLFYANAFWSAFAGLAALLVAGAASWHLYVAERLLLDPVTPGLAGIFVYMAGSLASYLKVEGDRRHVTAAFGQYLSPALVKRLAADPKQLALGGETRELTLMFCDVRGFTAISEHFRGNPQELTSLINRFLTPMSDVILAAGGTIDKYMGDCIMAFWNAPLDDPEHASQACAAAQAMMAELEALNRELPVKLGIGIGINTGSCVVGNMGSERRFDYSALGDAVNLASRLEGQSKTYGVTIVVSEETLQRAGLAGVELDLIVVKGKEEAVRIFTLGKAPQGHDAMLLAYRTGAWDEAEARLERLRSTSAEFSALYDLYAQRIADLRRQPPSENWNGVFRATSK